MALLAWRERGVGLVVGEFDVTDRRGDVWLFVWTARVYLNMCRIWASFFAD